MKYINHLTVIEKQTLDELIKHHTCARTRARAHAILLSDKRFKINELARIFSVDRDTASRWLNDWETYGLRGLYDMAHTGRPKKLTAEEIKMLPEDAFAKAGQEIAYLRHQQQAGELDLYFFDESGFSLEPKIPYAWQPKGKTLSITPSKSQRLNVLGFFSLTTDLSGLTQIAFQPKGF